jgi:hypothetical protein
VTVQTRQLAAATALLETVNRCRTTAHELIPDGLLAEAGKEQKCVTQSRYASHGLAQPSLSTGGENELQNSAMSPLWTPVSKQQSPGLNPICNLKTVLFAVGHLPHGGIPMTAPVLAPLRATSPTPGQLSLHQKTAQ